MAQTENPLLPIYLFNGDDVLKQETLLKRLQARIAKQGDLMLNSQTFLPKDAHDPKALLDALYTMPFASSLRLVIVKDVDLLSKPSLDALVNYVTQPSETTVLILIAKKLAKNSRLFKALEKHYSQGILDCGTKKRSELPALVKSMAQSEGGDISIAAANLLLELVGTSTITLSTEVKKLTALVRAAGKKRIDEQDVSYNVARLAEPRPWDLTDALAQRYTVRCLRLIGQMRGATAVSLFVQCLARMREILKASILRKRGAAVAPALGKQDWQIRAIMKGTDLYGHKELEAIIRQAPEIERRMKSGEDADTLLKLWIVGVCTGRLAD
jgi:DNA polymerase-3 subunit delta